MASFCSLLFRPAGTFYTVAIGQLISRTPPSPSFVSHISAEDLLLSSDLQKHMPILFQLINVLHLQMFCNVQHSPLIISSLRHILPKLHRWTMWSVLVFAEGIPCLFLHGLHSPWPWTLSIYHSFVIFLELSLRFCFYWCYVPCCFLFQSKALYHSCHSIFSAFSLNHCLQGGPSQPHHAQLLVWIQEGPKF